MSTRTERERRAQRVERAKELGKQYDTVQCHPTGDPNLTSYAKQVIGNKEELEQLIKEMGKDIHVVVYCRTSTKNDVKEKIEQQAHRAFKELKILGIKNIEVIGGQETGKSTDPKKRPLLLKAFEVALAKNGIVVGATSSRFLRAEDFDLISNPKALPLLSGWESITTLAQGIPLFTLGDPSMNNKADNEYLKKIEKEFGGKPKLKRKTRKERLLPLIIKYRAAGLSYREVANKVKRRTGISISHDTVWKWLGNGVKQEEGKG